MAEVVPPASKSVASLPRNWRRCFTFHRKFIQFVLIKNHFHAVKSLSLINLTNHSVSVTHFTIVTILINAVYCIDLLLVLLRLDF